MPPSLAETAPRRKPAHLLRLYEFLLRADFLKDLKIDFLAGIDDGAIQKQYGVSAFPTTVLIGVDGKVQFYESGALANADVAFNNLLANTTLKPHGLEAPEPGAPTVGIEVKRFIASYHMMPIRRSRNKRQCSKNCSRRRSQPVNPQ
jgi:hypothetical protein